MDNLKNWLSIRQKICLKIYCLLIRLVRLKNESFLEKIFVWDGSMVQNRRNSWKGWTRSNFQEDYAKHAARLIHYSFLKSDVTIIINNNKEIVNEKLRTNHSTFNTVYSQRKGQTTCRNNHFRKFCRAEFRNSLPFTTNLSSTDFHCSRQFCQEKTFSQKGIMKPSSSSSLF